MYQTDYSPKYEIWGLNNTPSDMDGGHRRFREDCFTLQDAKEACKDWQSGGRAAWIVEKESGQEVKI